MELLKRKSIPAKIVILLFFTVALTVSMKAQSGHTKPEVQPGRKAIVLRTATPDLQDSLTAELQLKKVGLKSLNKLPLSMKGFIQLKNGTKLTAESAKKKLKARGYNISTLLQKTESYRLTGTSTGRSKKATGRKVAGSNTPAASKSDFWKLNTGRRAADATASLKKLPVRVQTMARPANKVMVFIKNISEKTLKNLMVTIDRLPEEWSIYSTEDTVRALAPGRSAAFTFSLEGGRTLETVGFKLKAGHRFSFYWSARVRLTGAPTAQKKALPQKFEVYANYPDPFSTATTLSYALPQAMNVKIVIYDILGRRVAVLVNKQQPAGWHNMTWTPADLASGLYLCRMKATTKRGKKIVKEIKMMFIK